MKQSLGILIWFMLIGVVRLTLINSTDAKVSNIHLIFESLSLLEFGLWIVLAVCCSNYSRIYVRWRSSHGGSREVRIVQNSEGTMHEQTSKKSWTTDDYLEANRNLRFVNLIIVLSVIGVILLPK